MKSVSSDPTVIFNIVTLPLLPRGEVQLYDLESDQPHRSGPTVKWCVKYVQVSHPYTSGSTWFIKKRCCVNFVETCTADQEMD